MKHQPESRLEAERWGLGSQRSAAVERTVGVGDKAKNRGILGVGVGIVGILGPGHKPRMHRARMCLE